MGGVRRTAVAVLTLVVVLAAAACSDGDDEGAPPKRPVPQPARADGHDVVGYFPNWAVYDRNFQVKNLQTSGAADRLTHLVYAFGTVSDGRCRLGDAYADTERVYDAATSVSGAADEPGQALRGTFNQLRQLKKLHPRLKIVWSFGGWKGSGGFGAAADDPQAFARSCQDLLDDSRWAGLFDGIDVDWEYPNACGVSCDHSGRNALADLVGALRTTFGPRRLVTAAVAADTGKLAAADYAAAAQSLDWVMAMTYDFAGTDGKGGATAPHSALTAYPGLTRPSAVTDAAIAELRGLGIPSRKLLLGIGFYGRGWTGVAAPDPGAAGSGPADGSYEQGIEDYKVLAEVCPPTGTVGGTAYAYCGGEWWSYDTPQTIAGKMAYARQQGLGGAFVWELSGDTTTGDLLAAVRTGLG